MKKIGEVVGRRVERYRKSALPTEEELEARAPSRRNRPGLTQDELASRLAKIGHPLGRVAIANIEAAGRAESTNKNRTRGSNITLVDVLTLAIALDVPPVLLYVPLGDDEEVLVGEYAFHPHVMLEWARGEAPPAPLPDNVASRVPAWHRNAAPIATFDDLRRLQNRAHDAEARVRSAEDSTAAREEFDRRLRDLDLYLRGLARAGTSTPAMPDEWVVRMAELDEAGR